MRKDKDESSEDAPTVSPPKKKRKGIGTVRKDKDEGTEDEPTAPSPKKKRKITSRCSGGFLPPRIVAADRSEGTSLCALEACKILSLPSFCRDCGSEFFTSKEWHPSCQLPLRPHLTMNPSV
jgi:hypothetical protein